MQNAAAMPPAAGSWGSLLASGSEPSTRSQAWALRAQGAAAAATHSASRGRLLHSLLDSHRSLIPDRAQNPHSVSQPTGCRTIMPDLGTFRHPRLHVLHYSRRCIGRNRCRLCQVAPYMNHISETQVHPGACNALPSGLPDAPLATSKP
jgi:hypothetical protein